jgi:hypothetical protein
VSANGTSDRNIDRPRRPQDRALRFDTSAVNIAIVEVPAAQPIGDPLQILAAQPPRDRCRNRLDLFQLSVGESDHCHSHPPSLESEARPGGGNPAEPALPVPDWSFEIVTSGRCFSMKAAPPAGYPVPLKLAGTASKTRTHPMPSAARLD